MNSFLKVNKKFTNDFEDIWLGFRMGVYAFFCQKKFYTTNMNLTFYESLGQSKKNIDCLIKTGLNVEKILLNT